MELTEDDVLHILKLIDESKFDYFQLEVGELKITVSKGEPIPISSSPASAPVSQSPKAAVVEAPKATPASPAPLPHCREDSGGSTAVECVATAGTPASGRKPDRQKRCQSCRSSPERTIEDTTGRRPPRSLAHGPRDSGRRGPAMANRSAQRS